MVELHIDGRTNIESACATAYHKTASGEERQGFADTSIPPFADLRTILGELLVEAVLDCDRTPAAMIEVELPFDPFTA